jgi:glycosyltransferase involved in cell wall biosynthesis
MTKLSVVIITLNEERNIGRCLQSVKDIADEMLVVDSFSTDRTREICESFGAKFIAVKWKGYSGQKNHGNRLAAHDWILSVDADEALSDELRSAIVEWKKSPVPAFARFNRLTNYCGKWIRYCGWYPDQKLRIFNRKLALWEGEVHEKLHYDRNIAVTHLKGDLLHYSYYTMEEHIAQTNKFSSIGAKQLVERGKKVHAAKLAISPAVKFFRNYVLKRGFMDGYHGYMICRMAALHTFLKYAKARHLQQLKKAERTP